MPFYNHLVFLHDYNTNNIFLTLPKKKNQTLNSEFILEPLLYKLKKYSEENPLRFRNCVVCFIHMYDEKIPEKSYRDYDNVEVKKVLDVVNTFFLVDDSGRYCDMFQKTISSEKSCTQILIMDKKIFPQWLFNSGLIEIHI